VIKRMMLELDKVSLSYHSRKATFDHGVHHVLDNVSLRVYEGEALGIIGRNGVGKTTMLRLMAGILAPTSGSVTQRPGKTSSLLTIGLGFRPALSGRDNALLAAMLQGSTRKQAQSYLEEIKDFAELGDSFEEPVKTYSAGMRSRLGFTTALMTHVDILLIDEVLSVGDARFREKAQRAMKERISGDQTVVFVSHMDAQVQALCDRAIWIHSGRIMSEGDTAGVLQEYGEFINEGFVASSGHKQDEKQTFSDQRLDKLQKRLELSDEQVARMRKILGEGGGGKDVRAVLGAEQKQQWKQLRKRRKRRLQQQGKRPKGGKAQA
jgi:lipopolysaccharide transport system ATP-binding protein